MQELKLF